MLWLRLAPYAVSGLAVAAVWWLWADRASLQTDNARLARELAVQARIIEQAHQAREVEAARAERQRERAERLDASIEALLTDGGIPDADLDPRIIDYLDGLRPDD